MNFKLLTIITVNYFLNILVDYPDINTVWTKFQNIFTTVGDLIRFKDAFIAYTKQLLQEMFDDNIMYIEFRTSFSSVK